MGRLVVADVLPGNCQAILRIVHERWNSVLCGDRRRVDPQAAVVGRAQNELFTLVTKKIGAQRRCGLGTVVRSGTVSGKEGFFRT